jgi:hypothetical protein
MIILQEVSHDEFTFALGAEKEAESKTMEGTPYACVCEVQSDDGLGRHCRE